MIFVDANIWIYYFDQRLPEHKQVVGPLEREIRSGAASNTAVLIEVAHYFRNLPKEEFWRRIDHLKNLETLDIVDLDLDLLDLSLKLLAEYSDRGIGGRDTTILAAMKRLKIDKLITHDDAFKGIPTIEAMDPITQG